MKTLLITATLLGLCACTVNFAWVVPLYGDGSIITAAEAGKINTAELIGETGRWYFPFNTNCTVVFGDKTAGAELPAAPTGS